MSKRYYSREEAAEYCGLGLSTLNNLACAGQGPQYIKAFGRVLYDVADLDAWLQSMKVDPSTRRSVALATPAPAVKRGRGRPAKSAANLTPNARNVEVLA
jgi:hypothetical protein